MAYMFKNCYALKNVDLSKFKTNKVNNMLAMFENCQSLTSIDVSSFDTSKVTNFENMFFSCKSLTSLDLSNFNFEKWVSNNLLYIGYNYIGFMISYCESLTYLDISSVKQVISNFFEGLPSNGIIRCSKELKDYVKNKNYLPDWEWIIVE
jgi:surface protein